MSKREFEIGDVYDENLVKEDQIVVRNTLESIASVVTKESYTKLLSDDEITERRKNLADVSIEINDIEEEKKKVMDEFKLRLKKPIEIKKELLNAIKHKAEQRNGNLFHIDDQENGFMYIFDEEGVCVDSRPLRPTERQIKIKMLNEKQA